MLKSRPKHYVLLLGLMLFLSVMVRAQTTWYVAPPPAGDDANPGTTWTNAFASISNALAAAGAGGVGHAVFVSNGSYTLNTEIVFTQRVLLRSWNNGITDPAATVINGNYPATTNRCVYVSGHETLTVLDGFTFSNGHALATDRNGAGGGVYQVASIVTNCIFTHNVAASNGGGIFVGSTWSRLYNSELRHNAALAAVNHQGGGGAFIQNNGLMDGCRFISNSAARDGGGLFVSLGQAMVSNCEFVGNVATQNGGGAYAYYGGALLNNGWFSNNTALASGGGIYLNLFRGPVTNCVVVGNSAVHGAGVYLNNANVSAYVPVTDCLISNNIATGYGGGVYVYAATVSGRSNKVHNCRISNNQAGNGGGVYYVGTAFHADVAGCHIHGNTALTNGGGIFASVYGLIESCTVAGNHAGVQGGGIYFATANPLTNAMWNTIIYQNTAGGAASNWWYETGGNDVFSVSNGCAAPALAAYGAGNISAAPLFVGHATGNHRLQSRSPCVNAGLFRDWMADAVDLDGNPRIRQRRVDIGAYEGLWGGSVISVR